ncbi:MAG: hypothetical protein Q9195_006211 [Heterodermia aff. obscurata]
MVGLQKSSQPASAKKQQSISTFFAKTTSTTSTKNPIPSSQTTVANDQSETSGSLFLPQDHHDEPSPDDRRRSHTPKRTLDEDSRDNEDHGQIRELPPSKRPRRSIDSRESSLTIHANRTSPKITTSTTIAANGSKKPPEEARTSRYAYSTSPIFNEEDLEDDEVRRCKERLHKEFVKKLGRPDSISEIKRRNWQIAEDAGDGQMNPEDAEDAEEIEEEQSVKPMAKSKKGAAAKKGGSKLTPMEKQYLDIKTKHLDTILIYEVGYKFKFFGQDASIAAKELSIVCIPGKMRYDEHISEAHLNHFASASIPVHRLHVHVKRLVNAGHKVGIVRQKETAALKAAGDNRSAPFVRELTNVYTKGTYVDDAGGLEADASSSGAPATGYLVCMTESNPKGWGTDEKVHLGLIAVQPATGDVIYDDFDDGFMRSEVETRLLHIAPCEILVVGDLSKATEKLVNHLAGSKANVFGDKVRVERVEKPKIMSAQAYSHVSSFYAGKMKVTSSQEDEKSSKVLDKVLQLADNVTICLSAMITHMEEYGLEHVFDLTKYFQSFSARSHMLLNGTTLTSLEIYQNQTDQSEKGSLFWTLDRTKTRFGQRLLRKWVGRPLLVKAELEDRIAAVEELISGENTVKVDKIKRLVSQIRSDLEKSLIRIYYGKTMQRIAMEYVTVKVPGDAGFRSKIINDAVAALPVIAPDVITYLERINLQAAKEDDKYNFFREECESEGITDHKLGIASVEQELDAYRATAAARLSAKKVEYVTSSGIEYLIEVDNNLTKKVPASWSKISGTKRLSRYHTPEVVRLIRERDQHKEALAAACDVEFARLLAEISGKYQYFRDCVQALATLDCLMSLSMVATQPGYTKPEFTDETCIYVEQGRHPMVEQLLLDAYVSNDINLATDETRALLITGPNMGGKSSYVRQVALIAIMGQIGSYVPAASAKLGMLDAVFTRMGAFDNMMAGESTFMVELSETSDILKQASPRSLIILDELGRGTSTHDGVAIAQAVLDHVVRNTRSLTLFITHYQNLSALAKAFEHGELENVHMKFQEGGEDGREITFLYEVGDGVAHRSYGLNVARLANVPESVLEVASVKSRELEHEAGRKALHYLSRSVCALWESADSHKLNQLIAGIEQL